MELLQDKTFPDKDGYSCSYVQERPKRNLFFAILKEDLTINCACLTEDMSQVRKKYGDFSLQKMKQACKFIVTMIFLALQGIREETEPSTGLCSPLFQAL